MRAQAFAWDSYVIYAQCLGVTAGWRLWAVTHSRVSMTSYAGLKRRALTAESERCERNNLWLAPQHCPQNVLLYRVRTVLQCPLILPSARINRPKFIITSVEYDLSSFQMIHRFAGQEMNTGHVAHLRARVLYFSPKVAHPCV